MIQRGLEVQKAGSNGWGMQGKVKSASARKTRRTTSALSANTNSSQVSGQ